MNVGSVYCVGSEAIVPLNGGVMAVAVETVVGGAVNSVPAVLPDGGFIEHWLNEKFFGIEGSPGMDGSNPLRFGGCKFEKLKPLKVKPENPSKAGIEAKFGKPQLQISLSNVVRAAMSALSICSMLASICSS